MEDWLNQCNSQDAAMCMFTIYKKTRFRCVDFFPDGGGRRFRRSLGQRRSLVYQSHRQRGRFTRNTFRPAVDGGVTWLCPGPTGQLSPGRRSGLFPAARRTTLRHADGAVERRRRRQTGTLPGVLLRRRRRIPDSSRDVAQPAVFQTAAGPRRRGCADGVQKQTEFGVCVCLGGHFWRVRSLPKVSSYAGLLSVLNASSTIIFSTKLHRLGLWQIFCTNRFLPLDAMLVRHTVADPGFANGGLAPKARGSRHRRRWGGEVWGGVSLSPMGQESGEGALPLLRKCFDFESENGDF